MENRYILLVDLWYFQTWRKFDFQSVIIDEAHRISSEKGELSKCVERLPESQRMLLRRTKELVSDLPPKRVYICKIKMTQYQKRIYEALYPQAKDIKSTKKYNAARQMASSVKTCFRWTINQTRKIPEEIRLDIAEKSDKECSGNVNSIFSFLPDS